MRYHALLLMPFLVLVVTATASAEHLVPISLAPETASVLYAPAVVSSPAVTSLEPVAADYASTAPSLTEPYYTSSPAVAACGACGSNPCACAPCAQATYAAPQCGCAQPSYRPCAACGTATTYQPVVTFRPVASPYRVGHGLIGQPKLYVDGQPIRNTLRFFTP